MSSSSPNLLRNRLIIVVISLLGFVPFGAAWYLAKHPELLAQQPRANKGSLISPARPLDYEDFFRAPLTPRETLGEIKGHWVMLQPSTGPACGETCKETAQKTARIRLMLNKELSRVRRLLLMSGPAEAGALAEWTSADPTLLMTELNAELRRRLEEAVGRPLEDGMLILMDPLGNVMLWYPAGFDPYAPLKDLQRLLRISQIG